jgi:hypothetical protein
MRCVILCCWVCCMHHYPPSPRDTCPLQGGNKHLMVGCCGAADKPKPTAATPGTTPSKQAAAARTPSPGLAAFWGVVRAPGVPQLLLFKVWSAFPLAMLSSTFSLVLQQRYGLDSRQNGWVLSYLGACMVAGEGVGGWVGGGSTMCMWRGEGRGPRGGQAKGARVGAGGMGADGNRHLGCGKCSGCAQHASMRPTAYCRALCAHL